VWVLGGGGTGDADAGSMVGECPHDAETDACRAAGHKGDLTGKQVLPEG